MLGTYFEYKRCQGRMISEDGVGVGVGVVCECVWGKGGAPDS